MSATITAENQVAMETVDDATSPVNAAKTVDKNHDDGLLGYVMRLDAKLDDLINSKLNNLVSAWPPKANTGGEPESESTSNADIAHLFDNRPPLTFTNIVDSIMLSGPKYTAVDVLRRCVAAIGLTAIGFYLFPQFVMLFAVAIVLLSIMMVLMLINQRLAKTSAPIDKNKLAALRETLKKRVVKS